MYPGATAARARTMKAQPAAASVLCLCLLLAACAASAAGGLGKGQTNAFFGLSPTSVPTRGGSGPLSPRGQGAQLRGPEVRGGFAGSPPSRFGSG